MFKYFLTFLLFATYSSLAQTESFSEKSVGSTGDFTNQPVSLQSEFSHSQTIYYQKDLEFKGEINEIRFRSAFYQSKRDNVGNWIVRIGHTDKEEFSASDAFVEIQNLTEVFNTGYDIDGNDVIVRFSTPFFYNGIQNLIVDVQDTDPGFSTNATDGFRGEENFNNPPTRSKMTFTKNGQTTGTIENSFANTRFIGSLERCPINFAIDEGLIEETSATFKINNPTEINSFRYKIALISEDEPTDYQTTATDFSIQNLVSGKDYVLYYKSDCSLIPTSYRKLYFNTKPQGLTVPSSIDFETETNNYYLQNNSAGFIIVSNEAGLNGSTKGLLLNGSSDFNIYNWWDDTNRLWKDNSEFISRLHFSIDLTQNPTNPVFEFSLKQFIYSSLLRVVIDGQTQEYEYKSSDTTAETTRKIALDLSDFNSKKVDLTIEYLGKSHLHKSYIDDIQLKEASCTVPNNIQLTSTDDSITINWDSDATSWEILSLNYDEAFENTGNTIISKTHTFNNLEKAKPYIIFLRSKCGNSNSPWLKLYKSTKPSILEVPYTNDFRQSNALDNTDFSINHSRYSKIYQDFYKLLYLDQQSTSISYGWKGGFDTDESQAWNDNKNFISSVSFLVDATNLNDLTADIIFKQHYYAVANRSWFRIKINGEQLGNSYNPSTVRFDKYTELSLDLSSYVGNIIEVTLEQCGLNGPTNTNSITSAGDFTILRSINFNSKTLNTGSFSQNNNTIYPNPVTNTLNINPNQEINAIFLYDINGKLILSKKTKKNSVDISKLKSGLYFLTVKFANNTLLNQKVVKK